MDLMIDLETLGTSPDSVIVEIGAVFFDRKTGFLRKHYNVLVNAKDCEDWGLVTNEATIEWWQNKGVDTINFYNESRASLVTAIMGLWSFYKNNATPKTLVWVNGMDFDLAILRTAFNNLGMFLPWEYSAGRDVRTITKLRPDLKPEQTAPKHVALNDCYYQIEYLTAVLNSLPYEY